MLCLQETKVEDALFPRQALARLGFEHIVFSGQKAYHGVAIASPSLSAAHADDGERTPQGRGEKTPCLTNGGEGEGESGAVRSALHSLPPEVRDRH